MMSTGSLRRNMESKINFPFFVGFEFQKRLIFSKRVESLNSNILQNIQKYAYDFQG